MAISVKTHKMLWGRAANRCSFEECRKELVYADAEDDPDPALPGDEAHIVARKPKGPRGESALSPEERDSYNNLILLCLEHHRLVDKKHKLYGPERLREMKSAHEKWVRENLSLDAQKQKDEEKYAEIIEQWAFRAGLNDWIQWTEGLFYADQPRLGKDVFEALRALNVWLHGRVWPGRYPALESAFENFRAVLNDLLLVFKSHAQETPDNLLTDKFYKLPVTKWDEERYRSLHRDYVFHVKLVEDLGLELTRAANLVCDDVRDHIFSGFRRQEGVCLVRSGPYLDLTVRTTRVEYTKAERTSNLYPDLAGFKRIRGTRDRCSGIGESATDPEFLKWLNRIG